MAWLYHAWKSERSMPMAKVKGVKFPKVLSLVKYVVAFDEKGDGYYRLDYVSSDGLDRHITDLINDHEIDQEDVDEVISVFKVIDYDIEEIDPKRKVKYTVNIDGD